MWRMHLKEAIYMVGRGDGCGEKRTSFLSRKGANHGDGRFGIVS